jgi:diguanylate cyclase (GGDEF)-like protein
MKADETLKAHVNHTALRLKKVIDLQGLLVSLRFNLPEFMQAVVNQLQEATGCSGTVVELLEGDEMVYAAASGTVAPYVGLRLQRGNSLSGLAIRMGEVLISTDTRYDSRVDAAACHRVGAAAMAVVPLRRTDTTVGVLKCVWSEPQQFAAHEVDILQMMAGLLGAALGQQLEIDRRRQLEEELQRIARHDALTGLPNRRLFRERVERALSRHSRATSGALALMYFDIDHFERVNDQLGHAAGDLLLRAFAARMQPLVRDVDTFARLGGDEFALLLEQLPDVAAAAVVAEKILASTQEPFELEGSPVRVGSSIGVVTLAAGQFATVDDLIRRGDEAMYEAKRDGRSIYRLAKARAGTG